MEVQLYNNRSDNNVIGKDITLIDNVDCILKSDCDILNPQFILRYNDNLLRNINYMYVPELKRYYFVSLQLITGNKYSVKGTVDTLESYADAILQLQCLIDTCETTFNNQYLSGDAWVTTCRNTTEIKAFPQGLLDDGEFILITAGG